MADSNARATRRRGEELETTILNAALDELDEVGYERLTMEGVAARAQTGKQVLYRRWPNRAGLIIAAVRHKTGSIVDRIPDTGNLREDVLTVMRYAAARQRDFSPEAIRALLPLPAESADLMSTMFDAMNTVLRQASGRGEVRMDRLTPRITTLPTDLLRHEMLARSRPVDDATVVDIVDSIFLPLIRAVAGAGAGPDRSRSVVEPVSDPAGAVRP